MRNLAHRSVLITGGGSGIGAGTARYFAEAGAKVTICGRRQAQIDAVASAIGPRCHAVMGDVTSPADRARVLDAAVSFGGGLDVLVNNAGNMLRGPITALEQDEVLSLLNTNVVAGMMLTGLAVPHLEARQGSVIFVGSIHTRRAFPGASPYAVSKAAVETLTQILAAELGPRQVKVNCVIPGAVPTEINIRAGLCNQEQLNQRMNDMAVAHPLGRVGTEVEIAEAIAYLASAEWTTGASLVVDGGLSLGGSTL